ncbi:hypothetical protein N5C56_02190 [Pseudomonas chengduensis]|nr:hypothetical protein [Pseudomonas chengduensis]MDH1279520.1 hypothetical protein [Pseudomonas chengduensis]MDH1623674.1 hypothetical protein [Pseudomonas chengduensis]MDH1868502.1 hypothetical protein [Pseudomonas chengduensis]
MLEVQVGYQGSLILLRNSQGGDAIIGGLCGLAALAFEQQVKGWELKNMLCLRVGLVSEAYS